MVKNLNHQSLQVFKKDHKAFKELALSKGMRMDMLFSVFMQTHSIPPVVAESPKPDSDPK